MTLSDYPVTERAIKVNRITTANAFFESLSLSSCQLLGYLLLLGTMAFSTASYGHHNDSKAGTSDLSLYPAGWEPICDRGFWS